MSWGEVKYALNGTLGSEEFSSLDAIPKGVSVHGEVDNGILYDLNMPEELRAKIGTNTGIVKKNGTIYFIHGSSSPFIYTYENGVFTKLTDSADGMPTGNLGGYCVHNNDIYIIPNKTGYARYMFSNGKWAKQNESVSGTIRQCYDCGDNGILLTTFDLKNNFMKKDDGTVINLGSADLSSVYIGYDRPGVYVNNTLYFVATYNNDFPYVYTAKFTSNTINASRSSNSIPDNADIYGKNETGFYVVTSTSSKFSCDIYDFDSGSLVKTSIINIGSSDFRFSSLRNSIPVEFSDTLFLTTDETYSLFGSKKILLPKGYTVIKQTSDGNFQYIKTIQDGYIELQGIQTYTEETGTITGAYTIYK